MISISGGLIVTRTGSETRMSADFRKQVFGNPEPLMMASGIVLLLAVLPGIPKTAVSRPGGGVGWAAWRMRQRTTETAEGKQVEAARPAQAKEDLETLLKVEPLAVEVGLGLVRLVEGGQNSPAAAHRGHPAAARRGPGISTAAGQSCR